MTLFTRVYDDDDVRNAIDGDVPASWTAQPVPLSASGGELVDAIVIGGSDDGSFSARWIRDDSSYAVYLPRSDPANSAEYALLAGYGGRRASAVSAVAAAFAVVLVIGGRKFSTEAGRTLVGNRHSKVEISQLLGFAGKTRIRETDQIVRKLAGIEKNVREAKTMRTSQKDRKEERCVRVCSSADSYKERKKNERDFTR